MARKARKKSGPSVSALVASIKDEQTKADTRALMALMRRLSRKSPKLWNKGTIGFDSYAYKYDSGREGEGHALGFYPRKGKITVYLMDGTSRHAKLLARLGTHTTSRVCVYIKRLSDVKLPILEKILRDSYRFLKAKDGSVGRVE